MRYEKLTEGYSLSDYCGSQKCFARPQLALPRHRWLVSTSRENELNRMGSYIRDRPYENFALVSLDCTGLVFDPVRDAAWQSGKTAGLKALHVSMPIVISIQPITVERPEPNQKFLPFMTLLA